MRKEDFLELGKDVRGFEILDPNKAPPGLTRETLFDLWDIGVKWGQLTKKGIGFKANHEEIDNLQIELFMFEGNGAGGKNGMVVTNTSPFGSPCFLELKNGILVMWNGIFSPEKAQERIREIDEMSESIDEKKDGIRIMIHEY